MKIRAGLTLVEAGRKLVVWRYELVIDWSNIITEWSKPGRKELRVGCDHIRTGRIEI